MKIMSNAARPVYISTIKPGVTFGVKNPSRKNGPSAEMMTAMKIKMNDGRVAVIDMSTGHELPEDAVKAISYEPVEEACLETSKAARIGTIRPGIPFRIANKAQSEDFPPNTLTAVKIIRTDGNCVVADVETGREIPGEIIDAIRDEPVMEIYYDATLNLDGMSKNGHN